MAYETQKMLIDTLVMSPLQWADLKDIDEVDPINESDYECLVEIREILKKYGKNDRFGLALLHSHFELADDEVLVEYTDKECRVLTTKPVKLEEAGNTVSTIWKLVDGDIQSMSCCWQYCKRESSFHDKRHKRSPKQPYPSFERMPW